MAETKKDIEVLIVGAGPSGLMMACQLSIHKIPFRIIDKKEHPTSFSGALILQARTLEIFHQLGIAQKALLKGTIIHSIQLIFNGSRPLQINVREIGKDQSQFPSLLMLEQSRTEQLLIDFLAIRGHTIERNIELQTFTQNMEGVTSILKHADGSPEINRSTYLIAADGGHSLVRKLLNIPFAGKTYETTLFVTDCNANVDLPPNTICFSFSNKAIAGFFPLKDGRWRIDSVVPKELKNNTTLNFKDVSGEFKDRTRMKASLINAQWFSVFNSNQRYAETYQKGRCFLVGDSAHVCSPIGAQGMNTGIQDAYNLAWKIAFVINKYSKSTLLDSYTPERKPVAKNMIQATDRAFKWLTSQNIIIRNSRNYLFPQLLKIALPLLNYQNGMRQYMFKGISEIGIGYRESHLSDHTSAMEFNRMALQPGDRVPYCLFLENGKEVNIQDKLNSEGYHLVVLRRSSLQDEAISSFANEFKKWLVIQTITYTKELQVLFESFGIKNEGWILVRPDMHVADRGNCLEIESMAKRLRELFER